MRPKFKFGDVVLIKTDVFPRIDEPTTIDIVSSGLRDNSYRLSNPRVADIWYSEENIELYIDADNKDKSLHVPGAKDDAGKPPVGLLFESFPQALIEVAKVAGHGAEKYTRDGWRNVPDALNRYHDAACRHELKRFVEGEIDLDSGHYHLAHQAWNILALLEMRLNEDLGSR